MLKGNQLNSAAVNLKAIKGLLRKKGAGTTKSRGSGKDDKKTAMFVEAASKEKYNKCVVAFAIQVNKGNNAKAGFDKKLLLLYPSSKLTSTTMQLSFPSRGWIQANTPLKKRQTYWPSKSYFTVNSRFQIQGPLIV